MTSLFDKRREAHDQEENAVMDVIRPFTTRRHLPDRFISLRNRLCAWDMKTNVYVEKNSHDEYFRVFQKDGIPVFIVYHHNGERLANWIHFLKWEGPRPPSPRSTSGDPYYIISNGIPLKQFLETVSGTVQVNPASLIYKEIKRIIDWLSGDPGWSRQAK